MEGVARVDHRPGFFDLFRSKADNPGAKLIVGVEQPRLSSLLSKAVEGLKAKASPVDARNSLMKLDAELSKRPSVAGHSGYAIYSGDPTPSVVYGDPSPS